MKNITKILWGLVFIVLGIIIGVDALGIVEVNIFFEGWWTLFIIVPSIIGLFDDRDRTGSLIGLTIGIILLLAVRGVIDFEVVLKLIIPVILVVIGCSVIGNELLGSKIKEKIEASKSELDEISAVFKEQIFVLERDIKGAIIDAIFGHAVVDARHAKIDKETAIKVSAIFGSVDLLLPPNTNVKIKSTKILGSVERTTFASDRGKKEDKTIYIDAFSMFGGIHIK